MAAFSTFTDNFDDNSKDGTKWGADGSLDGVSTTGVVPSEASGQLQIALPTDSTPRENGYISANGYDLTGDACYVRLVQKHANDTGAYSGFRLHVDSAQWLEWNTDGSSILARYRSFGSPQTLWFGSYNSTDHGWLRIREAGGTTYWDTAPSTAANPPTSGEWTNRASVANVTDLNPMLVALYGGVYSNIGSPGSIIFDGLNTATTSGSQSLTPSLFTNTQTFFAATVTPGSVTLTPALFTNTQTFFGPTVSQGDVLRPGLVTNAQTFYGPTVAPGAVTLLPTRLTNSNTFFGPTVTGGERARAAGNPRKRKYFIELPDGRHLYGDPSDLSEILMSLREREPEKARELKKDPAKPKKQKVRKLDPVKPEPVKIDVIDWLAEAEAAGRVAQLAMQAMQDEEDELFMLMAA